jgi:serine/threonine protein kinase/tetratricopeptide (TPR) repeat protein
MKSDAMDDSPNRDVEVFTEAIRLPQADRAAYLVRACGDDLELRRRVEALLEANDQVGDFFEDSAQISSFPSRPGVSAGEKPGDYIGYYKLLQQIGEGGCGIVFMAKQEEPVRRRVALKIIKPGMDTKSVIARFEAERQALALMDHPNIAKIFDAGATESGRPYFVMELVRGIKMTEYCDQHSLTTQARLKLFVQVCQAVQHAHQKGIIHRDIKPSNILVTQSEQGDPLPVVIDFGIAKATTNQQLTDKTLFTAFEMLIGTPAYMSPEQAALTNLDVDTRTDVYSLGVLLYELLTGSTPFDTSELLKSGLDEIRRVIREQEPIRPSTRLSKLAAADLTTVAQRRHSEPPTLIRAVHGDLDWIVMKALEKDRTRRYPTAHGLCLDVLRFLADEAVFARPPSKFYKFQKVVHRNKLLFTGVGIIALLIVVSLIVVSTSLAKERRSRREAEAASAKSREVTKFLENMLEGVGPSVARGRDTEMLREILDETAGRVDKELTNQPEVEAELSTMIAHLYADIGHVSKGEGPARRTLAIRQAKFGTNSLQAAESLVLVAELLGEQGKQSEAEQLHGEALAIRRRLLGEENADTATSLDALAQVYRDQQRFTEAETMAREGLRIRQKLFGNEHLAVADSLRNLCMIQGGESRWVEAEKTAGEVFEIRRKLLGDENSSVASALADRAWALNALGRFEEAQKVETEALRIQQKFLGDTHPELPKYLNSLGQLLANRGDLESADAVLKAVLSIQRKLLGADNAATIETFSSLAKVLHREGKQSEAELVWREALANGQKLWTNDNTERLYVLRGLGETLESQNRWQEAEGIWRESLSLWRKRGGIEDQQSMFTLRKLGLTLEAERKWSDAESVHREALAMSRKKGDHDPEALVDSERLVRSLMNQKKFIEAKKILGEFLTPTFVLNPSSVDLLIESVNLNGRQGHWQEAATDAGFLVQLQPSEHYQYHRLAVLLAMSQSRTAYNELCQKIAAVFTNTANPYVDERVVQDCLLLPDSGVNLESLDKLADAALTVGSGEDSLPYFQACKAMSNYRGGHFRAAIEWAEKTTKGATAEPPAKAKAFAVSAMANWQIGEKDAARLALASGDTFAPGLADENADLGESWVAWIVARISLDEAASLIRIGSNPP